MTQTTNLTKSSSGNYPAAVQEYLWNWKETQIKVIYETRGQGNPVLLLPAFSTVSTREEMRPLAELLASKFQVVSLDWPGFGESDRPRTDYQPQLYHQFLKDFVESIFNSPVAVVAAGHAAGYAMQLAQSKPNVWSKIVLAAPTWRGPFADDEQTAKRVAWNRERISTIALTGTIPIQTKHCAVIPQFHVPPPCLCRCCKSHARFHSK